MDLAGAVCIVTGGSRGIGRAIVDALRAQGAIVETCSLSGEGMAVDVRSEAQVAGFVHEVLAQHGRIDVLINNAGVAHPMKPLEELSEAEYDAVMDTNVKGVFLMLRNVVGVMKQAGRGVIVNIVSRAGTRAHSTLGLYSASKFAVRGFTQALARELTEGGHNILCFSVSPGGVDTDMRKELFGESDSTAQQSPDVIAGYVRELISGERPVAQGDDVHISRGEIVRVIGLDDA